MVLAMLLAFIIIFASSIQWIARQSRATVDQEQEEQAFGLADTGVNYTIWLLTPLPRGAGLAPSELLINPPAATENHAITGDDGAVLGFFSIDYLTSDADQITLTSVGWDAIRPDICQAVDATLKRFANGAFRVTSWHHRLKYDCNLI